MRKALGRTGRTAGRTDSPYGVRTHRHAFLQWKLPGTRACNPSPQSPVPLCFCPAPRDHPTAGILGREAMWELVRMEVGSEMWGGGGGRRAQGKLELPAGPRGRPQKVMLKVVAGPDGGGGVRDSGERSLEQIKGGLQGGGLQGAGREEMRPEPRCQGANAKRGAQEEAGSVGTVVLGAHLLTTHPALQRGTTSWASASWARAMTGATVASTSAPS